MPSPSCTLAPGLALPCVLLQTWLCCSLACQVQRWPISFSSKHLWGKALPSAARLAWSRLPCPRVPLCQRWEPSSCSGSLSLFVLWGAAGTKSCVLAPELGRHQNSRVWESLLLGTAGTSHLQPDVKNMPFYSKDSEAQKWFLIAHSPSSQKYTHTPHYSMPFPWSNPAHTSDSP